MKLLDAGESTGYGRRFIAERPTWIGLVPSAMRTASGGISAGRTCGRRERRRVVGTVSMTRSPSSPRQRGDPGDDRRRRRARGGACARGRHDQLRAHDGVRHSPERTPRVFVDASTSSPSWARRWPERRAGSSAARCATSCSTPRGRHRRCSAASRSVRLARSRALAGPPFPLSERHGAWRIALEDGRTVDFTPLPGAIEEDLAGRDFTLNAMARPLEGGELVDPLADSATSPSARSARSLKASSTGLTRYACCVPSGWRTSSDSASTPRRSGSCAYTRSQRRSPPGNGSSASSKRLSTAGYRRLAELGHYALGRLGGAVRPDRPR